jgi:7-keto-8-aminopelargonate synthetase-like enzyme
LIEHLRHDRVARLFLALHERFGDEHLKDLVAEDMDDERNIRFSGRTVVNFGSDSFLGLDRDPRVQAALVRGMKKWGTHNGASRVFYSVEACTAAEQRLARWLGVPDTLILPSVTLANVGVLPGLVRPGDLLVVDRLAHQSIQEAAKIPQANGVNVVTLSPCTADSLRRLLEQHKYERCIVALDGIYSMTGRTPPLTELDEVARQHAATLYIDDAHGTGVRGDHGRGTVSRDLPNCDNALVVGSLSKAFSCMGAFVVCTEPLKLLLKIKTNTYIFGGPVPPPYLEAIIAVCDILDSPEYDQIIGRLRTLVDRLAQGARELGLIVLGGDSPIVSILVKEPEHTFQAGKWLFDRGFYVQSVVFPAVPVSQSVLRIQVNANHPPETIDRLLGALADLKRAVPLPTTNGVERPETAVLAM